MKSTLLALMATCWVGMGCFAAEALPAPQTEGGMPLLTALATRQTDHQPKGGEISMEQLSNILWAANGMVRGDKRTAPSARNIQEIDLSVQTAKGLFRYLPKEHALESINGDRSVDLKGASAVVYLTYKQGTQSPNVASVDAGFVGQNLYLYCASQSWPCVFLGSIDRKGIGEALGLKPAEVLFAFRFGVK